MGRLERELEANIAALERQIGNRLDVLEKKQARTGANGFIVAVLVALIGVGGPSASAYITASTPPQISCTEALQRAQELYELGADFELAGNSLEQTQCRVNEFVEGLN